VVGRGVRGPRALHDELGRSLFEAIVLPRAMPELFRARVLRAPSAVLLHGPPGTGVRGRAEAASAASCEHARSVAEDTLGSRDGSRNLRQGRLVRGAAHAPAALPP
jgi:hypothetical protein